MSIAHLKVVHVGGVEVPQERRVVHPAVLGDALRVASELNQQSTLDSMTYNNDEMYLFISKDIVMFSQLKLQQNKIIAS